MCVCGGAHQILAVNASAYFHSNCIVEEQTSVFVGIHRMQTGQ